MKFYIVSISIILLATNVSYGQVGSGNQPDNYIKNQLDEIGFPYEVTETGDFKLTFNMGDGRTQVVNIQSRTFTYRNLEIRSISSPGYNSHANTLPKSIANKLLIDSGSHVIGTWTAFKGVAYYTTRIDYRASKETLKSAIKITVINADEMENKLTGGNDKF